MRPRLPIVPRPYDDELLSSWQGRVACRYGTTRDELALWIGVPQPPASGFAAVDYAPADAALAAWARACRLDPSRLEGLALQRSLRPLDRYVWAFEARGAFVGFAACPACLEEDAAAGRDQYLRRGWLQVETLLCARHGLTLVGGCGHCAARQGFRFVMLEGSGRLACGRCGALLVQTAARREPPPLEKAVFVALGARPADERAIEAARLLWSLPRPGLAPRPLIFQLIDAAPAAAGAPWDRRAPLSTAALAWRVATWTCVAQLLDRAGARNAFGPARLSLAQLKGLAWRNPSSPLRRETISFRSPAEYRSMAEGVLSSAAWRARSGDASACERLLGRLMWRALRLGPGIQ